MTARSHVIYAKERLGGEELSPFINGDRFVYVNAAVSQPLPKETVICGHPCRIWHPSQKNFCKRCASHGQKKIVRIMTFSTYCAHNGPIFKDLSILTNDKLVIHQIGIMMYKFSNGLLPTVLNSLYQKNNEVHTYNTRAKNMLHIFFGTQSLI